MTNQSFHIGLYDALYICYRALRYITPALYTILTTREFYTRDKIVVTYTLTLGGDGEPDFTISKKPIPDPQNCNDLAVVRVA